VQNLVPYISSYPFDLHLILVTDYTINVQICTKKERLHVLLSLLERDAPKSGIIFVPEQVPVVHYSLLKHTI
jgi:hypothetical protein